MKVHFPPSPLVPEGWWFLHWFFLSWSFAPTTPWCSSSATDSIFMELGFIKTTEQICGSSVCWLVCICVMWHRWGFVVPPLAYTVKVYTICNFSWLFWAVSMSWFHVNMIIILFCQVQNGVMIYTTWTTIATLINLTIVLTYDVKMSPTDAATVSYSVLAVVLLIW